MTPTPFRYTVPEQAISDLRQRLALSRFPERMPGEAWAYGSDPDYMRTLIDYWQDGFDWRAAEELLASMPNFMVPIDGIDLHFLKVDGVGPNPKPLLLLHGWPGSVFEFMRILPRLTDPGRFGGDPADAFTVVAPSLPGFGLSFKPGQPRFGVEEIADTTAKLMTDVLGFERFGVQGGDWGGFITCRMGYAHPDKLIGMHTNYLPLRRDSSLVEWVPSAAEQQYLDELAVFMREEAGYQIIQGTRPQTLAFAMTDSPLGLAAWIAEKFRIWSDCNGDVESVFTKDQLLADISLYWFTGAIGSSFWPYYARLHGPWPIPKGTKIDVPHGHAAFPKEILRPPRSIAEHTFTNIQRWTEMPSGGHFAAMEKPEELAHEIQAFFRPLT